MTENRAVENPGQSRPLILTNSLALKLFFIYLVFAYLIRTIYLLNFSELPGAWVANGSINLGTRTVVEAVLLILIGISFSALGMVLFSRFKLIGRRSQPSLILGPRFLRRPYFLGIAYAAMIAFNFFMYSRLIGITGYVDFEPLPFKMAGALVYSRMFIYPLILVLIAANTRSSNLAGVLIVAEALLSAVFSGSRLISLLHTVPLLFVKSKSRFKSILFVGVLVFNFFAATMAREMNGLYLVDASAVTKGLPELVSGLLSPASLRQVGDGFYKYVFLRASGFFEFLVVSCNLNKLADDHHSFFLRSVFNLGCFDPSRQTDIKYLYGVLEGLGGGYGLDLFGFILYGAAGNVLVFVLYSFVVGAILGLSKQFAVGINRAYINIEGLDVFIYIALLLMVSEFRLFVPVYLFGAVFVWDIPVRLNKKMLCRGR